MSIGFLALVGSVAAYQQSLASGFLQRTQNKPELQVSASDLCAFTVDNSFYSLSGLYDSNGYYESDFKDYPKWKVVFNFCKPFKPLDTNCDENSIAAMVSTVNGTVCYKFASKQEEVSGSFDRERPYNDIGVTGDLKDSDMSKGKLSLKYGSQE